MQETLLPTTTLIAFMKTFPIYRATFGGSNDYMAQPRVRIAASNISQAVKRFKEWDECKTGTCGAVGNLLFLHPKWGWVRPETITAEHVQQEKDLRATRLNWFSVESP